MLTVGFVILALLGSLSFAKLTTDISVGHEKKEVTTAPNHGALMCITPTPDADQVKWKNGSTEHNIYLNADNVSMHN